MTGEMPFFNLFEALRKDLDNALGLDDYFILVEALQGGFGIDKARGKIDKDQLRQLCRALWLKPNQSPRVFEEVFEQYYPRAGAVPKAGPDATEGAAKPVTEPKELKPGPGPEPERGASPAEQAGVAWEKIRVRVNLGTPDGKRANISKGKPAAEKRTFLFTDDFFPVSRRQVQQIWRFLPDTTRVPGSENVDLEKTVGAMAQAGYLARLYYRPHRQTINRVILLTDHQGSMAAFDPLTNMLAETLQKAFGEFTPSGRNVIRYYFHNVPQDYVYENPFHTRYRHLDDLIARHRNQRCVVVVISDAGAARGGNSNHRVKATLRALAKLKRISAKIAWINPMPRERWPETSAERIARFVRMFDTTPLQLQWAVALLRGQATASAH